MNLMFRSQPVGYPAISPVYHTVPNSYYPYYPLPTMITHPVQIQQPLKVQQSSVVPVTGQVVVHNQARQPLTVKLEWNQFQKLISTINAGFDRLLKRL